MSQLNLFANYSHIIKKKLAIDISMLCHLIEGLCRNLILSAACHYDGEKLDLMLPRSWLSSMIDAGFLRTRHFNLILMLVGPVAELLTQIHTGVDAGTGVLFPPCYITY
jgi:hypothetical protein